MRALSEVSRESVWVEKEMMMRHIRRFLRTKPSSTFALPQPHDTVHSMSIHEDRILVRL